MSLRTPFSIGVQFNHNFSKRDHRNNDRWVRTSVATHSYPVFAGQLLSASSSGKSSLISTTLSTGISLTLPTSSLSLLSSRLLPLSLDRSLPESDNENLSLLLDIPDFFRKDDGRGREDIRQLYTHANEFFANETEWMKCNTIFIYTHEFQASEPFPAKKHNSFRSSQSTKMAAPNLPKSAFWHLFTCHKPFHLPQTFSPATNLF